MEYTKKTLSELNTIVGEDMLDLIQYIHEDESDWYEDSDLKKIIYRLIFIEEEDNTYSNINIVNEYHFLIALALYKNKYNKEYLINWKKPADFIYKDLAYLIILTYFKLSDDSHFIKNKIE
tara:strand:- start:5420 stop:5782 length:363 start_codon:yes stop_codon:yes gene_type:complete